MLADQPSLRLAREPFDPRRAWHAAGALAVVAAALASLGQTLVSGNASFLGFYLLCLVLGSLLAALSSGLRSPSAPAALLAFVVVYSVYVLLVFAFARSLTELTGQPFLTAPAGVVPDDERFYSYGVSVAEAWLRGQEPDLLVKFVGYPYVLGACLYVASLIGDVDPVSLRIVNAMFGALLPVTVYRIAAVATGRALLARRAALLAATFPIFAYYSALLLRDIVVAYLIAVTVLVFLELARRERLSQRLAWTPLLVVALAAVFFMRDLSAVVLAAGFALYVFLKQPRWAKAIMVVVGVTAVFQAARMIDLDARELQVYLTYTERAMEVFNRTSSEDSLGMRYVIGAPFPLNFILRVPYTALVPIPPIVGADLPNLVRGSGALLWYFLFPFWLYGMWRGRNNPEVNLLSVISLILLLGISLVSIDLRHKTQYLAFAMIHVAIAHDALGSRARSVVVGTFFVLGLLGIAYGYLRFAA